MLIRCDHCGEDMNTAEPYAHQAGTEVYYFCTLECMAESGYKPQREEQPVQQPETAS